MLLHRAFLSKRTHTKGDIMRKIAWLLVLTMIVSMLAACTQAPADDAISNETESPTMTEEPEEETPATIEGRKLIIHYYRYQGDYDEWDFWIWPEGGEGSGKKMSESDDFGQIAYVPIEEGVTRVGIIPRKGDWSAKDVEKDRFIDLNAGDTEVWLIEGSEPIYYERAAADISPQIQTAFIDDKNAIQITLTDWKALEGTMTEGFTLSTNGESVDVLEVVPGKTRQEEYKEQGYESLVNNTRGRFVMPIYVYDFAFEENDEVYLTGAFNNENNEDYKMSYDSTLRMYEIGKDITEDGDIHFGMTFGFAVYRDGERVFEVNDKPFDKFLGKSAKSYIVYATEDLDLTKIYTVDHPDFKEKIADMGKVIELDEFVYNGELGALYTKDATVFRVWSPVAEAVDVVLYPTFDSEESRVLAMAQAEQGVWELRVDEDLSNQYYNYRVTINGVSAETPDPYAKGATANGKRGMIVDFAAINPDGWENHQRPEPLNRTESVLYEMHVRDFSVDEDSGMTNKGKYLAFTESATTNENGTSTGLDHLKELGVTAVHLLPVYDFQSIDETKGGYNWGYDPYLYNVPEGSYATDPHDGTVRINEFKQMVQTLHENDIQVVMDVVYNHTFQVGTSPFDMVVPKYYYRTKADGRYSNGSGCGNETASEKAMMRKFMIDSVVFWATEYQIDGFRFDLMALHDVETMKEIEKALKEVNPNILIYGEPWMGGATTLATSEQFKKGSQQGLSISVFNDDIRNAAKGDNDGTERGYVNGMPGLEKEIMKGIAGTIDYAEGIKGFTLNPGESINYVSSHDNLCLFDKFEKSNPNDTERERELMNRLSLNLVLTSFGTPFMQGGTEILRTKQGVHNSYNSGDEINVIDWSRKDDYRKTYDYVKGLIEFRKAFKMMTTDDADLVRENLNFVKSDENVIAYTITSNIDGDYKKVMIIHNANKEAFELPIDERYMMIADGNLVNLDGLGMVSDTVSVPAISTVILIQN